ncbi:hypothetical protein WISP_14133 [Willisornis vidua]|uniref:Uncharacterized protein n=1 Tax=Willisornis vidua TaxID=1566151 RepID=A0ABQ9DQF5_9PASS|nr:hypothetical protein WISP_14133 [Willisornis vidua]
MPAVWLLLLALGLLGQPGGCRCPGGAPHVLPTHSGRNETLEGAGAARAPDVVVLVAMGGWLGAVLVYVGRFVRRSRAETRLHLEYLRALPCAPPGHWGQEEQPLSTFLGGSTRSKVGKG